MTLRYLYVMGAATGVGKSTLCLGLLARLLAEGYVPEQLAYIKPVTQCLIKQPVAQFCAQNQIACVDIGPLVFSKGFSQDFIDGLTQATHDLYADVMKAIKTISQNKSLVIIDGVGHPAVGSIVGLSNVDIALALDAKVIFVCPAGLGSALDLMALHLGFMQAKGLHRIGVLYNQLRPSAYAGIKPRVAKRLGELLPNVTLLGFVADHCPDYHLASNAEIDRWFSAYLELSVFETFLFDSSIK